MTEDALVALLGVFATIIGVQLTGLIALFISRRNGKKNGNNAHHQDHHEIVQRLELMDKDLDRMYTILNERLPPLQSGPFRGLRDRRVGRGLGG